MTNVLRLYCPLCKRTKVGVNETGLYRKHNDRRGVPCPNSGAPAS